ncbi:hypothetical protein C0993_003355 [Termitomyces sp. T159_Od127]|nr:hypothetical protein C0993_003355 [Termitomyces sp. T159_Od127]
MKLPGDIKDPTPQRLMGGAWETTTYFVRFCFDGSDFPSNLNLRINKDNKDTLSTDSQVTLNKDTNPIQAHKQLMCE